MNNDSDIFNLRHDELPPLRGSLLVAKPTVDDWCFSRSVILMIDDEDDEHGTMGLMLNNRTGTTVGELLGDKLPCHGELPVYLGGPVGTDVLFFLHDLGDTVIPEALPIAHGLWLGGDFDAMKSYLAVAPTDLAMHLKFIVGSSGWSAGQLHDEIERHDWAVLDTCDAATLMGDDRLTMWRDAVSRFGSRYRMWLNWPVDVHQN